ncbi:MAG: ACT domain-containing protein [Chthoniobacterales bacterium]|nr:ACT domain-containing protein [Chthoniobacterales bacterium]MCX7714041.1 ACT domain-containing protein [Chthoniobacterales bacterium]
MLAGRVAFLGPEGTFSHILAKKRFPDAKQFISCEDISDVFQFALSNTDSVGLTPVENSSGGPIYDTLDLLGRNVGYLFVVEELTLNVNLALLGHSLENVQYIYSHFAPLEHHKEWLLKKFPTAKLHPVASTAKAAKLAAEISNSVALASPSAAQIYGLKVLEFPLTTDILNETRFYLIHSQPLWPSEDAIQTKTALFFRLRNEVGSLHAFLGPFRDAGINLRMIVSRPIPGQPQTYRFFVEVDGVANQNPLASTLPLARQHTESLDFLGSFPCFQKFSA